MGYAYGMTAAQIATALGYTPANKAGDSFTGKVEVLNGGAGEPSPVALTAQQAFRIVGADGTFVNSIIESWGGAGSMIGRRANGTKASPTAPLSGETLFQFLATGYANGAFQGTRAAVNFDATENWDSTHQGARIDFRTTPNATTTAATRLRLDQDGAGLIRAQAQTLWDANGIVFFRSYTVATLPSAAVAAGNIYVSNETGGATPAFSDGTNWRRVADRAIVS